MSDQVAGNKAQALLLSARPRGLYTYKYTKGGQVWFVDIQPGVDGSHIDHISLIWLVIDL